MATPVQWSPPPDSWVLAGEELHVWRAPLSCGPEVLRRFEEILSPPERERAGKFLVPHAKSHFVAARGILRELLGRYLGSSPSEIVLSYGKYGKPSVCLADPARQIRFNLSHSHGYAAFVFANHREVGVDVEQIRPEAAGEDIAARFFSRKEIEELSSLPAESRVEGFFKCWTRKEAYIKARGEGLQIPLRSFSVWIVRDELQELIDTEDSCWSLLSFQPAPGFAGAVAAGGKGLRVRYWDWQAEMP